MTDLFNKAESYLIQADAFDFLSMLPGESVDLIITDPPYESLEKHRAVGTTTRLQGIWFPVIKNGVFPELFRRFYALLKKNSHCYMFCDDETSDIAIVAAKEQGFTYWKRIVWDKLRMGTGYHYRNQHEFILFFEKGKRKLNHLNVSSVLGYKGIRRRKTDPDYYPTEKPVDLIEKLIDMSSVEGETVLDPFAGSGSTLLAAKNLNRRWLGCDIQKEGIELAMRRLG